MGKDRAGREITKVMGTGRNRNRICNLVRYFAVEKSAQGQETAQNRVGTRSTRFGKFEVRVREV